MISFAKTSHRVVLTALLAVATIGAAHAITDSAFIYSTPKTGFYSIDSAALTPDNDGAGYTSNTVLIQPSLINIRTCFITGVNLPHAATVTQFAVWFHSGEAAGGQPHFEFRRKKFSDGVHTLIASRTIAEDTGERRALSVPVEADVAVINNAQYSYQVLICLQGNADAFYHGRLTYTYKNAGD